MSRFRAWREKRKKKWARRWKRFLSIPHLFAKSIVIFCILSATAASAFALLAQAHGATMDTVLAIVIGFFGGELLLLCLKTILKKDLTETEESNDEDPSEQQDL